jgi:hypothetical protein
MAESALAAFDALIWITGAGIAANLPRGYSINCGLTLGRAGV